ncbi:smg-9, nonsense mediated mRNA decay factor [Dissophora ornata]|nr:smg-9, nonsense mediated mRNA decay factor [Dissophora ornata]
MSRLQQQQQQVLVNQSGYMAPPPGLSGMNMNTGKNMGMGIGMGITNMNGMGVPPTAGRGGPVSGAGLGSVAGGGPHGRRERSGSVAGQLQQQYPQHPQIQQHTQQAPQQGNSTQHFSDAGQSQQSESDVKESSKSRRERRERSRRDRASKQSQQQQSDSGRDEMNSSNSNDGSLKQQQQLPQRVIVDPNSFQRQILQPNPNSGGGGGGERKLVMTGGSSRGMGELFDEDSRGSEVGKVSNRRQVPAGRTVYSWQGTNTNTSQQQQHQHHVQQQMQHHQQQHQGLRGPAGPYSQPGFKDPRSMGGPYSAGGGAMSVGGRPMQSAPIAAIPPSMGSHSVKLMNESGKIQESAEQWLSDHPGHFIVGILGTQGVGKSSLLSSFCPSPLASAAFTKQPPQMATVAGFQTSGIDMYITPERMILLDTEPIFCLSNLENALRNERITDGVPVDIWLDQQALIMATFLVSVCNVVLVMTEERPVGSSKVFKLLQRVEVFMKALSSASLTLPGNIATQGANTGGMGQPSVGQDGFPREGLGDWCADIVLVSNKVPTMQFGVDHYRKLALEQANLFQHSTLQLFGSINMPSIYSRFEDTFKIGRKNIGVASTSRRKRLSTLSASAGIESSSSDTESTTEKQERDKPAEEQQDSAVDDRKTAPHLNFVILPFDSTITSAASSQSLSAAANSATTSDSNHTTGAATGKSSDSASTLQSALSHLSISLSRHDILAASLRAPSRDVFGALVQDQERWKIWAKVLRNKVLSLSMRPQGGPALGPRNRPGMVSEREW